MSNGHKWFGLLKGKFEGQGTELIVVPLEEETSTKYANNRFHKMECMGASLKFFKRDITGHKCGVPYMNIWCSSCSSCLGLRPNSIHSHHVKP